MTGMPLLLQPADWLALFLHFLSLSLLSIGGAISTAPDMHRYLVVKQQWISDAQFNASIAIAQAAPGPNILFVAVIGWHVGANTGEAALGLLGAALTMAGILLPSTTFAYLGARWAHHNRELRAVRAFKLGMAPIVIALLIAIGWLLASANITGMSDWPVALLTVVTTVIVWKTRLHLLWLLAGGALLGWFGLV